MEYVFLIVALLFGGVYVAVLINGLEKNKTWAHEIALTIALMEPSRGYMDYSYLRRGPEQGPGQGPTTGGPGADPNGPNEPDEQPRPQPEDRLAA